MRALTLRSLPRIEAGRIRRANAFTSLNNLDNFLDPSVTPVIFRS